MRTRTLKTFMIAALAMLAGAAFSAQAPSELSAMEGSSLKIMGDSTLHKWEAKADVLDIRGRMEASKAPGLLERAQAGLLKSLSLTVKVEGLKSNEGSSMDKNMYKALGSAEFPEISFAMSSYAVKEGEVTAKGALTIHGVTKDVELKGALTAKDGNIGVKGSYDLLMSDYGIKPPVMMLGTVRVKDKVTIAYDYSLDTVVPKP